MKIFEVDVCATTMRDSCDGRQSVRNLADYKTILELVAMNDAGTVPAVFFFFAVILRKGLWSSLSFLS